MDKIKPEEIESMTKNVRILLDRIASELERCYDEGININTGVLFNTMLSMLGTLTAQLSADDEELVSHVEEIKKSLLHGVRRQMMYNNNVGR